MEITRNFFKYHAEEENLDYFGFTVQTGYFYGEWEGRKAAFSGAVYSNMYRVYLLEEGEWKEHWVRDNELAEAEYHNLPERKFIDAHQWAVSKDAEADEEDEYSYLWFDKCRAEREYHEEMNHYLPEFLWEWVDDEFFSR